METQQQEETTDAGGGTSEPQVYGDYEIVRPIGKGKFAVVYRARRISDGEVVALKKINVDAIDQKAREKCLKEVRLLQSLDHPNIIRYYDSFITDHDLVIVVEWAAAGDLKRQLRKAQERGVGFEERVIWKYFSQICDAMQHMHEKRIMHRDLKPANIFLTLDGTVKVGDLGLSRELSEHTIQAHSKVGTPLYMSPEVLRGDGYDFKSDIWSLGCLLYELAMLKSPFKAEGLNLYSLFQKISQGDYLPLPENYSEELRNLTYQMISTNSEDRPEISAVCAIAAQMRTLTAERHAASRKNSSSEGGSSNAPATQSQPPSRSGSAVANNSNAASGNNSLNPSPAVSRQSSFKAPTDDVAVHDDPPDSKSGRNTVENKGEVKSNGPRDAETKRSEFSLGLNRMQQELKLDTKEDDGGESTPRNGRSKAVDEDRGYTIVSTPPNAKRERPGSRNQSSRVSAGGRQTKPTARGETLTKSNTTGASNPRNSDNSRILDDAGKPSINVRKSQLQNAPPSLKIPQTGPSIDNSSHPVNTKVQGVHQNEASRLEENDSPLRPMENDRIGPTKEPKAPEHLAAASAAFAQMEILFGKLLALRFPLGEGDSSHQQQQEYIQSSRQKSTAVASSSSSSSGRKLLPIHFACDLSKVGVVAGFSTTNGRRNGTAVTDFCQFRRMVEVALWLCCEIGGTCKDFALKISVDKDPPMVVAKMLLGAAEAGGVPMTELREILPTTLLPGFGEKVCSFLNILADRAIAVTGLTNKALIYPSDDHVEEDQALAENDLEDGEIADDVVDDGHLYNESELDVAERSAGEPLAHSVLMPSIDAALWREETDRVLSQLAAAQRKQQQTSASSWGETILRIREEAVVLCQKSPVTETVDASNGVVDRKIVDQEDSKFKSKLVGKAALSDSDCSIIPYVSTLLDSTRRTINEEVASIQRGEGMINSRTGLIGFSTEFSHFQKMHEEFEKRLQEVQRRVEKKTGEVSDIEEKLEALTDQMKSDSAEGGANSELIRLKEAIKSLKNENDSMNVAIGMLSAGLLARRCREADDQLAARQSKQVKQRQGGKWRNKDNDSDAVDTSLLDDL